MIIYCYNVWTDTRIRSYIAAAAARNSGLSGREQRRADVKRSLTKQSCVSGDLVDFFGWCRYHCRPIGHKLSQILSSNWLLSSYWPFAFWAGLTTGYFFDWLKWSWAKLSELTVRRSISCVAHYLPFSYLFHLSVCLFFLFSINGNKDVIAI